MAARRGMTTMRSLIAALCLALPLAATPAAAAPCAAITRTLSCDLDQDGWFEDVQVCTGEDRVHVVGVFGTYDRGTVGEALACDLYDASDLRDDLVLLQAGQLRVEGTPWVLPVRPGVDAGAAYLDGYPSVVTWAPGEPPRAWDPRHGRVRVHGWATDTCVHVDLGVACWAEAGGWYRVGDGGMPGAAVP